MFLRRATLLLLLVLVLGLPTAEASLIARQSFIGEGAFVDLFGAASQKKGDVPDLLLFTGSASAEGRDGGLFFFLNPTSAAITRASRVEVYELGGDLEAIDRGEFQSTGRPIHKAFTNATINVPHNASFVIYNGDLSYRVNENFVLRTEGGPFNYSADAPFAFTLPVKPPKDLAGSQFNLTADAGLVLIGKGVEFAGTLERNATESFFLFPTGEKGNITVTESDDDSGTPSNFTIGDYAFLVYESAQIAVESPGVIVPFQANATASFKPAAGKILKDAFDPSGINSFTSAFTNGKDNKSKESSFLPKEVTENLNAISPLLNGALLRTVTGPVEVGGKAHEFGNFTLIRYSTATLLADASGVSTNEGTARFLLLEDGFASTRSVVKMGALPIPGLSIFLWVLAAGAIVASFLVKPLAFAQQVPFSGMARIIGWVFHGVCLLIAFVLWDAEIKSFLGTSLLTIFAQGAFGQGLAFAIVGAFEIIPLLFAFAFFAYPIRFLVNSGLKVAGFQKARGIGKGVGDIAAWALGAPFIPAFLNIVVGAFVKGIQGAF